MSQSNLIVGARVILYVNGNAYAPVVSFRFDSSTPSKAIYGLDSVSPYELAPTVSRINGTMTVLRQVGDGGIEGAGLIPGLANLPAAKYFSMSLVERSSDTQIFRADFCRITNQSWDVPSKGYVTGSISFEALSWNNEAAR